MNGYHERSVVGLSACENHSGVATEIINIKEWQKDHTENEHKEIRSDIKGLQTRLPNWAVFLIATLTALIGYLGKG